MNTEERRRLEREVLEIQKLAKTCSEEKKRAKLKKRYDEIVGMLSAIPPSPNKNTSKVTRDFNSSDSVHRFPMMYSIIVTLIAVLGVPAAYFWARGPQSSLESQSIQAETRSSESRSELDLAVQRSSSRDSSSAGPVYGKVGEDLTASRITVHVYQVSPYQSENSFDNPPVGYHRLAAEISIRNNSNEVFRPYATSTIEIFDDDGHSFGAGGIPPSPAFNSDALYAGDFARGWISLEVPIDLNGGVLNFSIRRGPPIRVEF